MRFAKRQKKSSLVNRHDRRNPTSISRPPDSSSPPELARSDRDHLKTNSSTGFPLELSLILAVTENYGPRSYTSTVPTPCPPFNPARIAV
jgi:hypothetical protein